MKLNLNKNLFNKNYWELQTCKTRWVVNWGSAGSSKSYSTVQHLIYMCLTSQCKILGIRKVSATLNDSCVSLVKDILIDYKIWNKVTLNKTEKRFEFPNGSVIMFKGIDDPEKIKSISGISHIWIEEASELDRDDLQQLNTRLRGLHAKNGQIFMCLNPVSEEHHIITDFIDKVGEREDVTCFHSTYKDNKFLDDAYGAQLEAYKEYDMEFYRVYCLGLPGRVGRGGETYKSFSRLKHVVDTYYNPDKTIIMSWDENVSPYSAVTLYHVDIDNKTIDCFDEIAIPDGNIQEVCREFTKRYATHKSGLILIGDASLYARSAKLERGANSWTLIMSFLKSYSPILSSAKKNESVVMRLNWINSLFHSDDIKIRINSKCEHLIKDFEYSKTNEDGTKLKKKEMCKIRGKAIEKLNHHCDTFDYAMCIMFMTEYKLFLNGGVTYKPIVKPRKTSRY
jgi:phage terminase large subunit